MDQQACRGEQEGALALARRCDGGCPGEVGRRQREVAPSDLVVRAADQLGGELPVGTLGRGEPVGPGRPPLRDAGTGPVQGATPIRCEVVVHRCSKQWMGEVDGCPVDRRRPCEQAGSQQRFERGARLVDTGELADDREERRPAEHGQRRGEIA